jgi:hypothetical protein
MAVPTRYRADRLSVGDSLGWQVETPSHSNDAQRKDRLRGQQSNTTSVLRCAPGMGARVSMERSYYNTVRAKSQICIHQPDLCQVCCPLATGMTPAKALGPLRAERAKEMGAERIPRSFSASRSAHSCPPVFTISQVSLAPPAERVSLVSIPRSEFWWSRPLASFAPGWPAAWCWLFGNFRGSRPDNASMLPHPGGAGPGAPIYSSEQVFATENPEDPWCFIGEFQPAP